MVVGVLTSDMLRLIPDQAGFALFCLEMPLHELRVTLISDETESMYTEAVLKRGISQEYMSEIHD